jgi:hypothetical protein
VATSPCHRNSRARVCRIWKWRAIVTPSCSFQHSYTQTFWVQMTANTTCTVMMAPLNGLIGIVEAVYWYPKWRKRNFRWCLVSMGILSTIRMGCSFYSSNLS